MNNVPHKFRQVCRLCLTLVNECDVAVLQIYDNSSHNNSAPDRISADFRGVANRANCFCSALSPNPCSCIVDNPLSANKNERRNQGTPVPVPIPIPVSVPVPVPSQQIQSQTLHHHQNQTKIHYTPSVPSAADAKSSERERQCQLESDIAERSTVFKSQSSSDHEHIEYSGETPSPSASLSQSQTKSEPMREEEEHQHNHNQQSGREETSVNTTNISGTDNYGKEHGRDDSSSPHLTFQIFNCLSIKVSRFPSNTFAKKRIYINYAHTQACSYLCVSWIYLVYVHDNARTHAHFCECLPCAGVCYLCDYDTTRQNNRKWLGRFYPMAY